MATSLEQYSSLEDKEQNFASHKIINTQTQLDDLIMEQKELFEIKRKQKFLFRGVSEAKYKLYTSFQRLWIDRDLGQVSINHIDRIESMVNHCSNKNQPLYKYFNRLGVICNDWFILSFLQHYGAATPLLDFSRDPYVALFFACDNVSYKCSSNAIDHYVSIYSYKAVDVANQLAPSIYKIATQKAENYTKYAGSNFWKTDLSFKQISSEYPLCIIPAYSNLSSIKNKEQLLITKYTVSNLNSTVQNGEFICNVDQTKPLETMLIRNEKKYIDCVDIHKGLVDYIIDRYLGGSLIEAKLKYYPQEKDIAKQSQLQMLSKICSA